MKTFVKKISSKKKTIAGLDIGASAIKYVELEGDSLDNATLVHYAIEPLPQGVINTDGDYDSIEAIAQVVQRCWKSSGSNTKHVTLSLPQSSIISKKVLLPIMSNEDDVLYQSRTEINKYLPTALSSEEIALDYFTLGVNPQSPTDNDMLLVAAKKEKIEERIALVEEAGLVPLIMDAEIFVMQNMLRFIVGPDFMQKCYLLADCSATLLRIVVFHKGELIYSKESHIGGENLTQEIMLNMGVSREEALLIKERGHPDELYELVVKTFLNNYAAEFLRSFQYFATTVAHTEIDQIFLTGGSAAIAGLEGAIQRAVIDAHEYSIRAKPMVLPLLNKFNKASHINLAKLASQESSLFLATGLALRHFLRPY